MVLLNWCTELIHLSLPDNYSFRTCHFEPRSCNTRKNHITARDKCLPSYGGVGKWSVLSILLNVCYFTEKFDWETSLNFQTELYCELPIMHLCSNAGTKMNSKCFHATIFCRLIIFGHKNNSKAIKEQLKPTFKMPRLHPSLCGLNFTHGCLNMKANMQTLQYSTETLPYLRCDEITMFAQKIDLALFWRCDSIIFQKRLVNNAL